MCISSQRGQPQVQDQLTEPSGRVIIIVVVFFWGGGVFRMFRLRRGSHARKASESQVEKREPCIIIFFNSSQNDV
jgi:hypothetical protein